MFTDHRVIENVSLNWIVNRGVCGSRDIERYLARE
jgi:hypothetical protein|tara:strand:+ start:5690 stop:5794 length:105 start_codon:yes stop_codon:yes gene_type:complete